MGERMPEGRPEIGWGDPAYLRNYYADNSRLHAVHHHVLGQEASGPRNEWVGGQDAKVDMAAELDEGTNDFLRHLSRMYRRAAD